MAESIPVPKLIVLEPGQARSRQGPSRSADLRWVRVEEFFRSRELAANTHKAYERELRRFLLWIDKPWQEITHRDIKALVQYLIADTLLLQGKQSLD